MNEADSSGAAVAAPKPRLRVKYEEEVAPMLRERFDIQSAMATPYMAKIVINMGVGQAIAESKRIDAAVKDLARIAGQQPTVTHARKSISNFRLREGYPVGCKVTLRGTRMWEFFDRLVTVAIPRLLDFRGFPRKSFDGRGNYAIGLQDQLVFPEIDIDRVDYTQGMNIIFGFKHATDEQAMAALEGLGFPFRRQQ